MFDGWLDETIVARDTGKQLEGRNTFFDLMVKSTQKTGETLKPDMLFGDIFNYLIAGMEATSYVLAWATYLLLTNPKVKTRLEQELFEANSSIKDFDHQKIMALPYLVSQYFSQRLADLRI
jgi:cytochrome P450